MDLNLPLDFERLPEYRTLVARLKAEGQRLKSEKPIEAVATHIWLRLWVELGYLAQTTNRAGLLTEPGARLFEASLEPMFGDDCSPVKLLVEAGCLKEEISSFKSQGSSGEPPEGGTPNGYFCERFARLNAHLAGDFKKKESKGAAMSEVVRSAQRVAHEAQMQGMLLPPELFKQRDGRVMDSAQVNRCMVVIKTLDNCLKVKSRTQGEYSETVIMDALAAAEGHSQEELRELYAWLILHRDHPMVPKTAEQILGDFARIFGMKS